MRGGGHQTRSYLYHKVRLLGVEQSFPVDRLYSLLRMESRIDDVFKQATLENSAFPRE